jgi:hypothetical protein
VSPELHVCLLQLPAGSASVEGKVEPHERKPTLIGFAGGPGC